MEMSFSASQSSLKIFERYLTPESQSIVTMVRGSSDSSATVSYTHLRAHETDS